MSQAFEALQGQQFINLTTYRKNGQPVVTTVWFAHDGDRIVGTTRREAGKLKRIRQHPAVSVAPSTGNGIPLGDALQGIARVLPPKKRKRRKQLSATSIARSGIRSQPTPRRVRASTGKCGPSSHYTLSSARRGSIGSRRVCYPSSGVSTIKACPVI